MPENQITANFIYLISPDFVIIFHTNYCDQVNSSKNFWKFWNGPLCRSKSGPFPLLNVAAYWGSSNTKACAKKLSQILVNNVDNGGGGMVSAFVWGIVVSLLASSVVRRRIYVRLNMSAQMLNLNVLEQGLQKDHRRGCEVHVNSI